MELNPASFALRGFIDQVAREWLEPIRQSGSELNVVCADDLGEMVGDSAKLGQAVGSLLSNAAKYVKNGRVTLAVSRQDDQVVISVRDSGPGMRPDQMANLFETFGRQEGETSSIYRETAGLGLPLSQRLCRLMQGDLTVDSHPDRGSRFTIRIPVHPAVPQGSGAAESDGPTRGKPLQVSS